MKSIHGGSGHRREANSVLFLASTKWGLWGDLWAWAVSPRLDWRYPYKGDADTYLCQVAVHADDSDSLTTVSRALQIKLDTTWDPKIHGHSVPHHVDTLIFQLI